MLEQEPVDFVITDINMPIMNGEQLLAALSMDEARRDLPVIVLSTDASTSRNERMRLLGARGYLSKPFSPERLRGEIERSMGVNE